MTVNVLQILSTQTSIYIGSSTNRVVTMRQKPFPFFRLRNLYDYDTQNLIFFSIIMASVQTKV